MESSKQKQEPTDDFNIKDIPIGECCKCKVKQDSPGTGGFWISGLTEKWACTKCKYGTPHGTPPIPSYPLACEWCTYGDVKWFQGHCYECPRCDALNIKHHEELMRIMKDM